MHTDLPKMCSDSADNGVIEGGKREKEGEKGDPMWIRNMRIVTADSVSPSFLVRNEAVTDVIRPENIQHPQAACLHRVVRLK